MPSSRAIASPVSLWSPVTMIGRMPAARHASTASFTSSRGGSICPTRPSNRARPTSESTRASDSGPSPSTVAKASTRSARDAIDSAAAAAARARSGSPSPRVRRSTASGAPLIQTRRVAAPDRCQVAISFVRGSNGSSARRGTVCSSVSGSSPAFAASTSRAPSVGSPSTDQSSPSCCGATSAASLQWAAACSSSASAGSETSATLPSAATSRPCGA